MGSGKGGGLKEEREKEGDAPVSMALHLFKSYWLFINLRIRSCQVCRGEARGVGEIEGGRERRERVPCTLHFSSYLSV